VALKLVLNETDRSFVH